MGPGKLGRELSSVCAIKNQHDTVLNIGKSGLPGFRAQVQQFHGLTKDVARRCIHQGRRLPNEVEL